MMHKSLVRPVFATLLVCIAGQVSGQAPQTSQRFTGTWVGSLVTPGGQLRLALDLTLDPSGNLSGVLTSLDQGNAKIPATITLRGDTVVVAMPVVQATYTAAISATGDSLRGSFFQGVPLPLNMGRGAPPAPPERPQEPKPPFPYRVDEVTFASVAGVQLAGTVTTPVGAGPFPAVVFVTGSGAQNRDEELLNHKPFLVIADYLARHGIAALRYDDRGFGKSTGHFASSSSADFADDAEAAVHFLQKQPGIAKNRVGIIGHSEGGLIAPIVAARSHDVAFLVLLAGPGLPGDTLMQLQRAALGKSAGSSQLALERGLEANHRMFAALRQARDSSDAAARLLVAQKEMVATLPQNEQEVASQQLDQKRALLLTNWWRYFLTYDPKTSLGKLRIPVLAMNGTLDLQVPSSANLPEIDAALKAAGNRDYRIVEMPGLNHLFQTATTGDPSEYQRITETFSPAALEIIGSWITAHTRTAPKKR